MSNAQPTGTVIEREREREREREGGGRGGEVRKLRRSCNNVRAFRSVH